MNRFYKRHYVPGNFVVAAAGNVRHDDVLSLLATRMETGRALPEGDDSTWNLRSAGHPPSPSGTRLVRRRKTEQAHICLGTNGLARTRSRPVRVPGREHRARRRDVVAAVPGDRGNGAAWRTRSTATTRQYTEAGLFTTYAGTTPARAEEVIGLLRRELEDVASGGLTEEEFERAEGHVKGSLVLSLEDPGGRMSRLGKSEIAHGEILSVSQTLARIERVTLEDARRVAERVLSQPMTLTVLGPFAGGAFQEVMA